MGATGPLGTAACPWVSAPPGSRCPLAARRTQAVPGEGNPLSDVVLVGEGPGAREDATGRPFVGPAGRLLDELEQGVEALARDHVGLVDDVDLVAAVDGSEERPLAQVARVVDTAVAGGVDLDDVEAARASARQVAAALALAARVRDRGLLAVERAGEDARARRLAAATRAGEEVGVVDAVVGERVPQRVGHVRLADHLGERLRAIAPVQGHGFVHASTLTIVPDVRTALSCAA